MEIQLKENWKKIKEHFRKSRQENMHVSIASVNANNEPTVTPIGSLFLNDDQTGFYFEKFATKLKENKKTNKNICVLAVNTNKWFWLKSLFLGKFLEYPGVKLYGELGIKRDANEAEFRAMQRRVRKAKLLKGYTYLWKDMSMVREIKFIKAEKINLARMTRKL
ncbi:hypothetical protein [Tenacibaculum aiptasiae]|uniref:hypothetical protein n=1 Tax=Tenacibaculum aiptasiae TaxID=426481 RepID=UPI00232A8D39|nr:hypothetical protein [Tenacibaculum aiptasiae]